MTKNRGLGARVLRVGLAAAIAGGCAFGAAAATLKPKPGLDGLVRIALGASKIPPASVAPADGLGGVQDSARGRQSPGEGGEVLLAAAHIGESALRDRATNPDTAEPPLGTAAPGSDPAEPAGPPEERRSAEPPAFASEPFGGPRPFGGASPCHWDHPSFGAPEHRDRCGYPAVKIEGTPAKARTMLAGSIGGGRSPSSTAPPPGVQPAPTQPGGAIPPKVAQPAPVPVPAAWVLLATAAAPLLLRRRRR